MLLSLFHRCRCYSHSDHRVYDLQYLRYSGTRRSVLCKKLDSFPSLSIIRGECYVFKITLYLRNPRVFPNRSSKKFIIERALTKCSYDFIHHFRENVSFTVSKKITFSPTIFYVFFHVENFKRTGNIFCLIHSSFIKLVPTFFRNTQWVHISICRSFIARSKAMFFASCFVSDVGSIVS